MYPRKLVVALIGGISLFTLTLLLSLPNGSFAAHGTYTYDPRRSQPPRLIAENQPDAVLIAALQQQLARDGTYPKTALARVIRIEPTQVQMHLITDWQASVQVATLLHYHDGTIRQEVFHFHAMQSQSLPFIDTAVRNVFGRLGTCTPTAPGVSHCPVG
jgi:hypothetical protein